MSTRSTNEQRIRQHILSGFSGRPLSNISRTELQIFLNGKAATGLSFSTVDHLRWDLKQIFGMAYSDGLIRTNPATELYTSRQAQKRGKPILSFEEVQRCLEQFDLRERLILKLAVLVGMRPGEIFALRVRRIGEFWITIEERVYRGKLDSPKTHHSVRTIALSDGVVEDLRDWLDEMPASGPEAWVFPSETLTTPAAKDNVWRRHILPKLKLIGLGCVNFQVLRRTHASLMKQLKVDSKVVADQLGHTLDVNLNTYTQTSLARRKEAVDTLEASLIRVKRAISGNASRTLR